MEVGMSTSARPATVSWELTRAGARPANWRREYGCAVCGKPTVGKYFCGHACTGKARELSRRTMACERCGTEFRVLGRNPTRRFCSHACRVVARLDKTCVGCGKTFAVLPTQSRKFRFCSLECKRAVNSGTCARCGKAIIGAERRHCSESCRRPPVTASCLTCGKTFRTQPSIAAARRYCTMRCYVASTAPTVLEDFICEALARAGLVFERQVKILRWTVDFLVPASRTVVEADGDYWHSKPSRAEADRKRDAAMTAAGYSVIRIRESVAAKGMGAVMEALSTLAPKTTLWLPFAGTGARHPPSTSASRRTARMSSLAAR